MLRACPCDLTSSAKRRVSVPLRQHRTIRFSNAGIRGLASSWRAFERTNRVSWVSTASTVPAYGDVATFTGAAQNVVLAAYNGIATLVPWEALLTQPLLVLALAVLLLRFLPPLFEVASRAVMVLAALLFAWYVVTHPSQSVAALQGVVDLTLQNPVQASILILAAVSVALVPYLLSGVLLVSVTLWLLSVSLPL